MSQTDKDIQIAIYASVGSVFFAVLLYLFIHAYKSDQINNYRPEEYVRLMTISPETVV